MRRLYLAWRYSGGRLCPYRLHHNLDGDFRPLDAPAEMEWTLSGRRPVLPTPRPPMSHRRLRNVLLAFAQLAEDEEIQLAGMSSAGMGG